MSDQPPAGTPHRRERTRSTSGESMQPQLITGPSRRTHRTGRALGRPSTNSIVDSVEDSMPVQRPKKKLRQSIGSEEDRIGTLIVNNTDISATALSGPAAHAEPVNSPIGKQPLSSIARHLPHVLEFVRGAGPGVALCLIKQIIDAHNATNCAERTVEDMLKSEVDVEMKSLLNATNLDAGSSPEIL